MVTITNPILQMEKWGVQEIKQLSQAFLAVVKLGFKHKQCN